MFAALFDVVAVYAIRLLLVCHYVICRAMLLINKDKMFAAIRHAAYYFRLRLLPCQLLFSSLFSMPDVFPATVTIASRHAKIYDDISRACHFEQITASRQALTPDVYYCRMPDALIYAADAASMSCHGAMPPASALEALQQRVMRQRRYHMRWRAVR